jgi:hypothetical protein
MNILCFSSRLLICCVAYAVGMDPLAEAADDIAQGTQQKPRTAVTSHLLLDSRIIKETENVTLTVGVLKKNSANPLFGEDKPWEPRYDNMYPNVIYDAQAGLYKCWYTPFVISKLDENTPRDKRKSVKWDVTSRRFGLCYAISKDGLQWEKPDLRLVELRGSNRNNIMLFDVHGPDVIKDMRESDPSRRYKMFGTLGDGPHMVWFSSDGLDWSEPIRLDLGGFSDTHNNVFWCPERNEYVGITREKRVPRTVGRTSSADFVHWSKVQQVLKAAPGKPELHDMVAFPYAGIYLGLIGVYDVPAGHQWVELAWSPDTVQWHRIQPGTPLIPNSSRKGDYDWGCIFATRPIVNDEEIRIYYAGCNGKFFDWRDGFLCLATLPKDRWAGYRSNADRAGTILTQPLVCSAENLRVTADAKDGAIEIEVLNDAGTSVARSAPIRGNVTDAKIDWTSAGGLKSAIGKRVTLRISVDRAIMYSFVFVE